MLYTYYANAHGREQLAQSCYLVAAQPGIELTTSQYEYDALTTKPPGHLMAWMLIIIVTDRKSCKVDHSNI